MNPFFRWVIGPLLPSAFEGFLAWIIFHAMSAAPHRAIVVAVIITLLNYFGLVFIMFIHDNMDVTVIGSDE